ncbi:ribbon-helix-helix protein, CopG family, partial [Xanthomonas citri pv. citri]|nr:ribbon-helix-helix protein, CopG family [Xanthomonas citri pv. citri]
DDLEQIEAVRRGRPTLERQAAGQAGESKMLRVRVTPGMDAALVELSRQRGTTKSEVVRELLAERLSPAS